MATTPQPW